MSLRRKLWRRDISLGILVASVKISPSADLIDPEYFVIRHP